jgi:hypothetical protein
MPAPTACGVESESLVVGMALVPGLESRNRSFALFEDPDVRRASRRAAMLRGIVRQLAGAQGHIESLRIARVEDRCELCYSLPGMKMQRRASLSDIELACVRYLAARAGASGLKESDQDREAIDAALRRLAGGLRLAQVDVDLPQS